MEKFDTVQYNKKLCEKYPWLKLPARENDTPEQEFEFTELDLMPDGWRNAFGERMCEDIQKLLVKANYVDQYHISQIKEKYGELRWYDNGVPEEISDEFEQIIQKYEKESRYTCIGCGKPATRVSTGWFCPFCDECTKEVSGTTVDIHEYYREK